MREPQSMECPKGITQNLLASIAFAGNSRTNLSCDFSRRTWWSYKGNRVADFSTPVSTPRDGRTFGRVSPRAFAPRPYHEHWRRRTWRSAAAGGRHWRESHCQPGAARFGDPGFRALPRWIPARIRIPPDWTAPADSAQRALRREHSPQQKIG